MIGVYILDGPHAKEFGYLFNVNARTAEVVTMTSIIRVDISYILPLDIANNFSEVEAMVKNRALEIKE